MQRAAPPSTFASLTPSDKRLLSMVGIATFAGLVLGIVWTSWIHDDLLRSIAEHSALQWGNSLTKDLDRLEAFETGAFTPEHQTDLKLVSPHGDIFRYELYNSMGEIFAASRIDDVGYNATSRAFFDVVAKGQTHVDTKLHQIDGPVRHYAEVYLPVLQGTIFRGAVKVYVNIERIVAALGTGFKVASTGFIALLLASAAVAAITIFRNIAARTNAETRLHEAIETISEGFLMYDPSDRLVICNSRYREIFSGIADLLVPGVTFEQLIRAGVKRGQYPQAEGRVEEWIAERLKQHREPRLPIERQLPNGRWVKITETQTRDGSTVGIRTDITDLKQRERQLQRSEERLNQVVNALQDGFVLYDADDRMVMWNKKWIELHDEIADVVRVGVTFEEILRTSVSRNLYPDASGCEGEFIAARLARHRSPTEPIIRKLHDGRWYIIREAPTAEGGIFAVSIDITDLKNAENAAQEARMQAEAASRTKSEFLANMSHELRTPLTAVIGFSEAIKRQAETNIAADNIPDYIEAIHSSGIYLLELINGLLDFSKIEAGKLELHETRVDLGCLLQDLAELVSPNAEAAGLRLRLPDAPALPTVMADEIRLRQILLNLLSNAIKFTPKGGEIVVSVFDCGDGSLPIAIRDSGIGMSEADLRLLGEPFRQFGKAQARNQSGTGLGVSLAKALAEMHGARLDYASMPGEGTTATLVLPARRVIRTVAGAQPARA
jgi:PAS domain S-box-containing protein